MKLEWKPTGEANFYRIVSDKPGWVAQVQLNGELHLLEQEKQMRAITMALELVKGLLG